MSKHEALATLRQLKEFAEEAAGLAKGRSRADLAADLGFRRHAERVAELIGEACNRLPVSAPLIFTESAAPAAINTV